MLVARPSARKNAYFKQLDDVSPAPGNVPEWLKVNRKKLEITVSGLPTREDAEPDINEQLIVEYYSR
jgi:small subunit ribosomal protein S4